MKIERHQNLELRNGETLSGPIYVDGGTLSCEDGVAVVQAGLGDGVVVTNGGTVRGLRIVGDGPLSNRGCGIRVMAPDAECGPLLIQDVEVEGFGIDGVAIAGEHFGYRDVTVCRVRCHQIGETGIHIYGAFDPAKHGYAHHDVLITDCVVHHVTGRAGAMRHSGSGIVVSDVERGSIENCQAHDNGKLNTAPRGGPIGIWAWDCRDVNIRRCESFRNRTASPHDGGGFGLDGGAVDCSIEDCYSHDNDGAGFCLSQFPGARPFRNCQLRGNRSENDALRNNYGAIHLWCDEPEGIRDVVIENNRVVLGQAAWGRSRGIRFQSHTRDVVIRGNEFVSTAAEMFALEVESDQTRLVLAENRFHVDNGVIFQSWQGTTRTME